MSPTHSLLFIAIKLSSFLIVSCTLFRATVIMYLVSRTASFAKLFFFVSFCGLVMYVFLAFYTFHMALTAVTKAETTQQQLKLYPVPEIKIAVPPPRLILIWTTPEYAYNLIKGGRQMLLDNGCVYTNCILTTNKTQLNDVSKFDAIVFSIDSLSKWKRNMPKQRSPMQKYVFYSMMPANEFPVCNVKADDFFNWTWTYKLYSDIPTPFIEVKDLRRLNNVVAPKTEVEWLENDYFRSVNITQRSKKYKTIMWINENCDALHPKTYAKELKKILKESSLDLDIFGCNHKKCPEGGCLKIIENYYFYLVYEQTLAEDYMTTEVLKAYDHNAVPVVIGGADYNKFLPPGSYIDGRYETPEGLASLLVYITKTSSTYDKFFDWQKHYTIKEANINKGYCQLCQLLHDKVRRETHSSYETFRKWWYYGNLREKCYPKGVERFDDVLSYIDNPALRKKYIPRN